MKTEVQIQTKPYLPEKDMNLKPVLDRICQELDIEQDFLREEFSCPSHVLVHAFSLFIRKKTGLDFRCRHIPADSKTDSVSTSVSVFITGNGLKPFILSVEDRIFSSPEQDINLKILLKDVSDRYNSSNMIVLRGKNLIHDLKNFSWEEISDKIISGFDSVTGTVMELAGEFFSGTGCTCSSLQELFCQVNEKIRNLQDEKPDSSSPGTFPERIKDFITVKKRTATETESLFLSLPDMFPDNMVSIYWSYLDDTGMVYNHPYPIEDEDCSRVRSERIGPGFGLDLYSDEFDDFFSLFKPSPPCTVNFSLIDNVFYTVIFGVKFKTDPVKGMEILARLDLDRLRAVYAEIERKVNLVSSNIDNLVMIERALSLSGNK